MQIAQILQIAKEIIIIIIIIPEIFTFPFYITSMSNLQSITGLNYMNTSEVTSMVYGVQCFLTVKSSLLKDFHTL